MEWLAPFFITRFAAAWIQAACITELTCVENLCLHFHPPRVYLLREPAIFGAPNVLPLNTCLSLHYFLPSYSSWRAGLYLNWVPYYLLSS